MKMTKHPGEYEPIRPLTKEEREARKAFSQTEAKVAMSDYDVAQQAFADNRERLKAERLVREADIKSENEQRHKSGTKS